MVRNLPAVVFEASSRQRAYDSFVKNLLAHRIRPGQFLSQRELVDMTGLPIGTIRELVSRLEGERLVNVVPSRGMQIAYVDIDLVKDAFQYRLMIEKEATASFIETATDQAILAMRREHEEILEQDCLRANGRKPESDMLARARDVDSAFHAVIVDSLGNRIISEAYRLNSLKLSLIRQERGLMTDSLVSIAMGDHLRIIAALERRDGPAAVAAMSDHVLRGCSRALSL